MSSALQRFRLSYGDCDAVGIAYFAIYYPWMERTYSTWLYHQGLRSGELGDELGIVTVGVHSAATYLRPVHVFDELTCEVVRREIRTSSYALGFEFRREQELVTSGTMTFVCRTPDGAKTPVPARLAELLGTLRAAEA